MFGLVNVFSPFLLKNTVKWNSLHESIALSLSVESSSHLLWFCITTLYDWLEMLAPLSQPIRCKTGTNPVTRSHTFSRASHRLHCPL